MLSSKLSGNIVKVRDLGSFEIERMFYLMNMNYADIKRSNFEKDLSEKSDVILLKDKTSWEIQGFSTLMILEDRIKNESVKALFSGDTIIDKNYWGDSELECQWGRYAFSLIDKNPNTNLYWLLMSKGYKTYRFLPVFFNDFYPRFDKETPIYEKEIINVFANKKFPDNYDSSRGLVLFNGQKDKLRKGIADIEEFRLKDPHINYFVKINPNWMQGDELVCLVKLSKDNFNHLAHRVINKKSCNSHI